MGYLLLDPFSSTLFVYCNHRRGELKILHWDHAGFWLYYRRLERSSFQRRQAVRLRFAHPGELRWVLAAAKGLTHTAKCRVVGQTPVSASSFPSCEAFDDV
ncbi:IS66 family insertion sequence element accessory protein TnpB [Paenibacillus dendritiformis]|uniref:IS66 family insertion sequence element accessory protein TnpB n=1 Tax=Paenibacillus dendritiformis TaxID=130049 RepID=UPI00364EF240